MATSIAVVTANLDTASTTTDFTSSGFGTPVGAIIKWNSCTTLGTADTHVRPGMGFFDGTRNRAVVCRSEDGIAASDCERYGASTKCFVQISNTIQSLQDDATGSWITDGLRLTFSGNPTEAYEVTVVLFGGADMECYAGTFDATTADDDITAPGFKPSIIFFVSHRKEIDDTFATSNFTWSYGIATQNSDVIDQYNYSMAEQNNRANCECGGSIHDNAAMDNTWVSSLQHNMVVSNVDADGFTAEYDDSEGAGIEGIYLAVKPGDRATHVTSYTIPGSTGDDAQTGPGFEPQAVGMILSGLTTLNTHDAGDRCALYSWGVSDSTTEATSSCFHDDGAATMNTGCVMNESVAHLFDTDGSETTHSEATISSFDSSGYTANWSAVSTGRVIAWAIEKDADADLDNMPHYEQDMSSMGEIDVVAY